MCDCSIRVTAALEYLESAFHLPRSVSLFHCASIMNTLNNGVCHRDQVNRLLRGMVLVLNHY